MNVKLVNLKEEPMNEANYGYMICECTKFNESIRVDRPKYSEYIKCFCPRCGRSLGIVLKGKGE